MKGEEGPRGLFSPVLAVLRTTELYSIGIGWERASKLRCVGRKVGMHMLLITTLVGG